MSVVVTRRMAAERATPSLSYRTGVFCNNCGHRNPPESKFLLVVWFAFHSEH